MKTLKSGALALAAGLLVSGPAFADISAVATTDLNIRSGPGPQYPVVGVIGVNQAASIEGCAPSSKWCEVNASGTSGWAYSDYLSTEMTGEPTVVARLPQSAEVPTVTPNEANAATGAVGGAVVGALIGGPVGAAIGGAVGAGIGMQTPPPAEVDTYVTQNRVDPVYLDGEVVVGAGVPDPVQLRPIPDYKYQYAYVNGQPVLVDAGTRQIVYVYR